VNTVVNLWLPYYVETFLSSCLSSRAHLHEVHYKSISSTTKEFPHSQLKQRGQIVHCTKHYRS
jgi:hypothetical protein